MNEPAFNTANTAAKPTAPVRHLNQTALARRWDMSTRTLERWRWEKKGVPWMKLGGHVAYRLEDIEAYEQAQRRG
jgi:hypothetical protein